MTNDLTAKRGFVGKVAVWLLLTLGAVLLAVVVMGSKPQPAQAGGGGGGCSQPEEGYWVNKGSVDFVERIQLTCNTYPTSTGGVGHSWWAEVWGEGTCGGTPCTLHWYPKQAVGYTDSGQVYVRYNHQFSTDHLYANMSKNRPGVLWVHVQFDWKDTSRSDSQSNDWLSRP
jgi:hypothetical protein